MEISDIKNCSIYLPIDRVNWWLTDVVTVFWLSSIAIKFILYSSAPLHDYAMSYIIDKNKKAEV